MSFNPFAGRRKLLVGGVVAGLTALLAGGALAFILAASSGSVSTTSRGPVAAPPPVALTVAVATDSGILNGSGPVTAWSFGFTEQYTLTITNPATSTGSALVGTAKLGSWSSTKVGCDSTGALAGTFSAPTLTINQQLAPGASITTPVIVVTMNNLPTTDQSVCVGATPTFTFQVG